MYTTVRYYYKNNAHLHEMKYVLDTTVKNGG